MRAETVSTHVCCMVSNLAQRGMVRDIGTGFSRYWDWERLLSQHESVMGHMYCHVRAACTIRQPFTRHTGSTRTIRVLIVCPLSSDCHNRC